MRLKLENTTLTNAARALATAANTLNTDRETPQLQGNTLQQQTAETATNFFHNLQTALRTIAEANASAAHLLKENITETDTLDTHLANTIGNLGKNSGFMQ